ncbi:opacity protein-like surface antigen [Bradyrhizobium sp. LM3.2]
MFDIPTGALFSSARETRWGGTVGAGLEYGFAPNWSVGVEYNHIFLGDRTIDFTTPIGGFAGSDRIRQDVDMGLVRVNYRWGGPSIAHY